LDDDDGDNHYESDADRVVLSIESKYSLRLAELNIPGKLNDYN
jgi:hypothetical protein